MSSEEVEHFVRKEHFLGVELTPHLRDGHAADEIVKLAEEIDADLLQTLIEAADDMADIETFDRQSAPVSTLSG